MTLTCRLQLLPGWYAQKESPSIGEKGYMRLVEGTMRYIRNFQDRINAIEGLTVLGKPDMPIVLLIFSPIS